jgi:hypothetical protein
MIVVPTMMKTALAAALIVAGLGTSAPAVADPTVTVTLKMPERTIYGRPDKPMVVIDVKTPTAASQAGAAHETFRAALMRQYEPKRAP